MLVALRLRRFSVSRAEKRPLRRPSRQAKRSRLVAEPLVASNTDDFAVASFAIAKSSPQDHRCHPLGSRQAGMPTLVRGLLGKPSSDLLRLAGHLMVGSIRFRCDDIPWSHGRSHHTASAQFRGYRSKLVFPAPGLRRPLLELKAAGRKAEKGLCPHVRQTRSVA